MTINTEYNGDIGTELLKPGSILRPGESVVLEIFHSIAPIKNSRYNIFLYSTIANTGSFRWY
jgi:hypothetical protein